MDAFGRIKTVEQVAITPASIEDQPMPVQSGETSPPSPQLPDGGLPEGWTAEQWGHYGQQYLDAQGSQEKVFSQNGTELK